jgi:putative hemolysin
MRDLLPNPIQPLADVSLGVSPSVAAAATRGRLHRESASAGPAAVASQGFRISWARHQDEVKEAQRLRYKVFAEEMGARLPPHAEDLDADEFDDWCDHLLVRDAETLKVVGTYRVLPPHHARQLGRLYSDAEFDLSRLDAMRPGLLELGRSCVHHDFRSGSVIMALWAGLGEYMQRHGYTAMLGCSSVSMADGGHHAASLYRQLSESTALSDPEYRVFPRLPLPLEHLEMHRPVEVPALLKGYLRLGARICGAPAWDPDFGTADFLTLLRLSELHPRYARHFLGQSAV